MNVLGNLVAFDGLADVQRRQFVEMSGLEPIMQGFGGRNATENLVNGMNAALAVLKKYTSTLSFDPNRANEIFDRIEVWQDANGAKLRQLMQQGAKTVPEQIAMQFGPDEAKSFIVASFSEAARGIKGWAGGAVQKNYKTNPNFTESMALADRESRMITFASIVQLERSGTLAKIFAGQSLRGDDGLGAVPLAVVIIAAAVAVTAVALCAYEAIRQSALNKKIDKLCEMDEALCKQVLAETIREEASSSPLASGARTLGTALGIGIVAYVGATVVLPKLLAGKRSE